MGGVGATLGTGVREVTGGAPEGVSVGGRWENERTSGGGPEIGDSLNMRRG
jgi:hypothetical protein